MADLACYAEQHADGTITLRNVICRVNAVDWFVLFNEHRLQHNQRPAFWISRCHISTAEGNKLIAAGMPEAEVFKP